MDLITTFKEQWPIFALIAWFGYKWWNSRRVVRMLPELKAQGAVMIDVRSAQEFASGQAPGTINIPLPELGSRLQEIPRNSPVVLCCASGTRSGMAKLMLRKNGFSNVYNVGAWTKLVQS
jgi:rhodanese-related sulfurtransferase